MTRDLASIDYEPVLARYEVPMPEFNVTSEPDSILHTDISA
jgi:hypothetical protein